MAEFPFDGRDLVPTPAQAELIEKMRALLADAGVDEPDVIQPRPTNPEAIELFWVEQKLCVVIESEQQMDAMFAPPPPAEAA